MSSMQVLNRFDGASSTARDRRIGQLLDQTPPSIYNAGIYAFQPGPS